MELLQLRYFLEAAELENFSLVAKNHMVPQPAISNTIKKLEDELGIKLFDRNGRNVSLNKNGQRFYEEISNGINSIDRGISLFTEKNQSNILLYVQAGSRFVSLLTADFLTSSNHVFVSRINDGSIPSPNKYDFTFMQLQDNMNAFKYEELMKDEIVAVVSKKNSLSKKTILSIKDLAQTSFVAYYKSINLRDFTDEFCKQEGDFIPIVVFETADYSSLRYMVEKNKGIALLPKKFFKLQPSNQIKVIPLKEKVYRSLVLAWDKNKILSKQGNEFVNFTKKWFENM